MENQYYYDRYPRIMNLVGISMDTPIYTMEDGSGEYVSYMQLYGYNVIYEQNDQGFIALYCVDNETLEQMISEAEEYYEQYDDEY